MIFYPLSMFFFSIVCSCYKQVFDFVRRLSLPNDFGFFAEGQKKDFINTILFFILRSKKGEYEATPIFSFLHSCEKKQCGINFLPLCDLICVLELFIEDKKRFCELGMVFFLNFKKNIIPLFFLFSMNAKRT